MNNNTIEYFLSEWGRAHRQLPANNQVLKNRSLERLAVNHGEKYSPKARLPWLSFAFASLAVLTFVILTGKNSAINNTNFKQSLSPLASTNSLQGERKSADIGDVSLKALPPQEIANSNASGRSNLRENYYPDYPPTQEIPASDNRQFIKTDYSAGVKTRNVQELALRIQTTVRGFDGRIDSADNSSESGFLSFVLPSDKLEGFKAEVKSIAGARFYSEALSSQNMLSNKRALEDQQTQGQDALAQLNASRDNLTNTHSRTVASLNSQLNSISGELAALKTEAVQVLNYDRQLQIQVRQKELQDRTKSLNSRLAKENADFQGSLNSLDYQIRDQQANLDQLGKQTGDLLNSVATVRGIISLSHISVWELIGYYIPAYWLTYGFLIAAAAAYFLNRRKRFTVESL